MPAASTRITVVTPSYNQAQFLDETLRSVLSQRDQVHEYFVFDGGSTDGSVDIIKKYERCITYWTSEKDRGQSDAIMKGFARATGDVLCWINSDDLYLPGALAKVREAFDRQPQWDVLTGYHVRIDENTRVQSFHRSPRESLFKARLGIYRVSQQACFFKRSIYEKVGGLKMDMHCLMDTDLWLRMFQAGARWGHVPEYLAGYRWHSQAKMLGTAWAAKSQAEHALVRQTYPQFSDQRLRTKLALPFYRMVHGLSPAYLGAHADTKRWQGKPLTDVFGDWRVEGC